METAVIVLTVAVSIQTLVMIALAVGAIRTRRQVQVEFDRRYQELSARIDDAARPLRQAAEAVEEVSHRAAATLDGVDYAVSTARSVMGLPGNLVTAGITTLAGALLRRWSRRSSRTPLTRAPERGIDSSKGIH